MADANEKKGGKMSSNNLLGKSKHKIETFSEEVFVMQLIDNIVVRSN